MCRSGRRSGSALLVLGCVLLTACGARVDPYVATQGATQVNTGGSQPTGTGTITNPTTFPTTGTGGTGVAPTTGTSTGTGGGPGTAPTLSAPPPRRVYPI
mgnify:CR=1 FL=1